MGKNYSVDRDKKGRYRHSYVFMRETNVEIKLLGHESLLKGKVSTIEEYYCVLDVEGDDDPYQVTVNFAEIKYIRHQEFVSVEERSPNYTAEDKKILFVFDIGEKITCAFKDGKGMKGFVLSEGAYYLYIKTEKGKFYTIMKSALSYILHDEHPALLETNDFYTEEMKAAGYSKPTEYVFSVGDQITVFFANSKSVTGVVLDESKYWVLLQSEKLQITVLKGSYSYFKHEVYETKPYLYLANKRLKKMLRNDK
ncbi:hypothetical protein GH876_29460 [Bacillus thuringiensis]|uniref:hypothetical protein n=1 Tax=Bacillus cereus group sp. BfR-BA-01312 TaxID=2920289 RepID=UPI001298BB39|nr:hypothetical protein [Bacillus cereus group sp. BfR-BA-01312]MEB8713901.1 hypothetical protein [Bacillus cereus]MEB9432809.1 hypothetical protein [Bacillus cereus]MEB9477776.1 hypothetical protein [Bacillus cereus]MRB06055.1 hypothetical protein [Bacillus thuringiensis]